MMTQEQKESILGLSKKFRVGAWIAYHALLFWEWDVGLAEDFMVEDNLEECFSTFDFPRWALPPKKARVLDEIDPPNRRIR